MNPLPHITHKFISSLLLSFCAIIVASEKSKPISGRLFLRWTTCVLHCCLFHQCNLECNNLFYLIEHEKCYASVMIGSKVNALLVWVGKLLGNVFSKIFCILAFLFSNRIFYIVYYIIDCKVGRQIIHMNYDLIVAQKAPYILKMVSFKEKLN